MENANTHVATALRILDWLRWDTASGIENKLRVAWEKYVCPVEVYVKGMQDEPFVNKTYTLCRRYVLSEDGKGVRKLQGYIRGLYLKAKLK